MSVARVRGRLVARLVLVVLAGLALGFASVAPAAAHNSLRGTSPAANAAVDSTPAAIVLTFDEPAIAMGTKVVVTGPSGPVQVGEPRLEGNTVVQALQPGAPAGSYTVTWRVTSDDGHPVEGTFSFVSGNAGTESAAPATAAPTTGSSPEPSAGSLWAAGLAVLMLAVVLAVMLYAFQRARALSWPRYDRTTPSDEPPGGPPDETPTEQTQTDQSRTESRPPSDE